MSRPATQEALRGAPFFFDQEIAQGGVAVDAFTERLFDLAYQTHPSHRRREVSLRELVVGVEQHWTTYRDGTTNR
jgi:hypothetical protein